MDFLTPIMGERVKGFTRQPPIAFPFYYPRRYVEPASHFSPKCPALLNALATDIACELDPETASQELWELVCAGRLAKARVPTWWVGSELFVALTQTAPPLTVRWEDVLWPVPAVQFMLPIKESRAIFERNVPCLSGSIGPAREVVVLPPDKSGRRHELCLAPSREETLQSLIISGTCYYLNGECDGTLSMHTPITAGLTVGEVFTGKWPHGFDIGNGANCMPGDKERLDLMMSVFVQLMMLLSMKSDVLVSGGDCIIGAVTEGKGEDKKIIKPSLFATRWVGEHFKHERGPSQGGTHASPEMHLRAGHWRDQPVGKGRSGIKQIWIKPVWVNAPKDAHED